MYVRICVGAIAVNADTFREGRAERLLTEFNCDGDEHGILGCPHNVFSGISCTTSAIICQGT